MAEIFNARKPVYDTTYDIWERVWRCQFSRNKTTSEDYYRIYGKPSTGYKYYDKQCPDEVVDTMINIDTMVEYFKQGITVGIYKYEDCEEIYKCIERHLQGWRQQIEHGINIGDAPIEDLVAMDEFANAIYDKAKYLIKPEIAKSLMVQHMSSITSFNRNTLFGEVLNKKDDKPTELPERDSMANVFKSNIAGYRRWR